MSIKIHIPSYFQHYTNKLEVVEVNGSTVGERLDHLVKQSPDFEKTIFTGNGKLPAYIAIWVNGEDSYPEELAKPIKDGDELSIKLSGGGCC